MSITLSALQRQRRDTAANWTAENPTLLAGEIGIEADTGYWKVGDGVTAWTSLAYLSGLGGEIPVDRLANGTARQLLQTDAAGTGVEWTDNVDVPGTLDVTGAGTFDGNVTIAGDLTVNGTTTTINTQDLLVKDKNIEMGVVDTPTDVTADGGGITLKGTTDKTISWVDATDAWTFSEHVNIASAKEYRIAGTKVLDATSLGSAVVSSSLTSVGTIGTGVWQGTAIDKTYLDSTLVSTGDTGTVTSTMIADGTIVNADVNASAAIADTKLGTISTAGKVSNSATTATSANTASAIVARDGSGNFSAGTITASLTGAASSNVLKAGDTMTGALATPLGSAAAPSLTFTGDTNTGIYSPGADQVAVATNGTGRLFVASNGSVGVGVSSPGTRLEVAGSAAFRTDADVRLTLGSSGSIGGNNSNFIRAATDTLIYNAVSGRHSWEVAGSEKVRITSAGLVGIGTSSPSAPLTVRGGSTSSPTIRIEGGSSGNDNARIESKYNLILACNGDGDQTGRAIEFRNDDTNLVYIDSSGNVGIGTTSPGSYSYSDLVVAGSTGGMSIVTGTSDVGRLVFADGVAGVGAFRGAVEYDHANDALRFASSGSERARIDSSGRLLVGTSSASGVNSNTAPVLAGNFVSFTGSVSANHNTATTLFTLENLNATYMVTAVITGTANAGAYHAVYIIGSVVTNSHSIQALKAGSLLTLSLSGANVQATQGSGVAQTVTWSVTRMANL